MKKRNLVEWGAMALLLPAFIFLVMGWWPPALAAWLAWYLLYGFVGLATMASKKGRYKRSNFWLAITLPYALVPFRRAFYWWLRADNTICLDPGAAERALSYALRVKTRSLYSTHNEAVYCLQLAELYFAAGQAPLAVEAFERAEGTPHKETLEPGLQALREKLNP